MAADLNTSEAQLKRLQSSGKDCEWEGFYRKYSSVILSFCRKHGLDESSASDVLQETMVVLIRKLPGFAYQPEKGRFRNWLLSLVYNKIREAWRRTRRLAETPLNEVTDGGESLTFRLSDQEDPEVEAAWKLALIEEALRRIKSDPRVKAETMAVFEACVLQNMEVSAVAAKFCLQENNIYQIKSRLLRRVREVVEDLEQNRPGALVPATFNE